MIAQPPHQPPVVPSNAPPYGSGSGDDGPLLPSRVLQEHSGNSQGYYSSHGHGGLTEVDSQYRSSQLNENGYPKHFGHMYQERHYRHQYRRDDPRVIAEQEVKDSKEFKVLYRRFLDSDGYRKYRGRQVNNDKNGQDLKWPEHLEIAFFRSLVKWKPMGRRQLMWKDKKKKGRNELIADNIEELTGEMRTRKQISSHIQVLKPFVIEDHVIMRYLSTDDLTNPSHGGRYNGGYGSTFGRRMSHHPVSAPPSHLPPLQTVEDIEHRRRRRESFDFFQPRCFDMFVQVPDEETMKIVHKYTKSISDPRQPDIVVPNWATLEKQYPLLSAANSHQILDCNVLAAEASLAIPLADVCKNGAEIGIRFTCSSREIPANAQIQCHTKFLKDGQYNSDYSAAKAVEVTTIDDGGSVEAQVPFGSTFWAPTLHRLGQQRWDETHADVPQRRYDQDVHTTISNITALQEVFLLPGSGPPERLLVISWTFRLSSRDVGRTCWKKLLLPSSTALNAEPKLQSMVDPLFDFNAPINAPILESISTGEVSTLPTLQSPFEYDSHSAGSALSSATWPTSISDAQTSFTSLDGLNVDNTYDFTGGHIDLSYQTSALPLEGFDHSAFDVYQPADTFQSTNDYIPTDPALQALTQNQWDEGYGSLLTAQSFHSQAEYTAPMAHMSHPDTVQSYASQSYNSYHDQQYDQQAYAGGEDERRESGLGALADASYLAQHSASTVHL